MDPRAVNFQCSQISFGSFGGAVISQQPIYNVQNSFVNFSAYQPNLVSFSPHLPNNQNVAGISGGLYDRVFYSPVANVKLPEVTDNQPQYRPILPQLHVKGTDTKGEICEENTPVKISQGQDDEGGKNYAKFPSSYQAKLVEVDQFSRGLVYNEYNFSSKNREKTR